MSQLKQLLEKATQKNEMKWRVYAYDPAKDNKLVHTSKTFDCINDAGIEKAELLKKNPDYMIEIIAESAQKNEATFKPGDKVSVKSYYKDGNQFITLRNATIIKEITEKEAGQLDPAYNWKEPTGMKYYLVKLNTGSKKAVLANDLALESAQKSESKVNMSKLKNEIQAAVNKYFKDDKDLLEYVYIDTKKDKFGRDVLEVRAELGYNGMVKLAEYLDKIVTKYDKYAYFDQETSGIMTAVFESVQKNEDKQSEELDDLIYHINDRILQLDTVHKMRHDDLAKAINANDLSKIKSILTNCRSYTIAKDIVDSFDKAKKLANTMKEFSLESAQKNESLRDLNLELADDTNAIAASADKIRQRFEYRTLQNQSYDEKQAEKLYLEVRRELEKAKKLIDACYNKIG